MVELTVFASFILCVVYVFMLLPQRGWSPLRFAIELDRADVLRVLLSLDPKLVQRPRQRFSPDPYAGHLTLSLVAPYPGAPDSSSSSSSASSASASSSSSLMLLQRHRPLYFAVANNCSHELLRTLIEAKAPVCSAFEEDEDDDHQDEEKRNNKKKKKKGTWLQSPAGTYAWVDDSDTEEEDGENETNAAAAESKSGGQRNRASKGET
jgi:hypothetical protein